MNKLSIALLFLCACPADDATVLEPDGGTSIVYPCSLQDAPCKASYDLARIRCDHKYQCDDLFVLPYEQCVSDEMASACASYTNNKNGHCYDASYDRTALDACLMELNDSACNSNVSCEL